MDVKSPISFDEQIEKLETRGCFIADKGFAKQKLQQINYYRLTAYFLPFKISEDKYRPGTSFETVYRIYEFDRRLRNLIFSAVEEIELMLRSRLAYFHAMKYGPLGYLNPVNFNLRHNTKRFENHINSAIEHNKGQFFVKHHIDKYDSQFPLWVIIELFTMGELSFFFSDLLKADKKQLARELFKTSDSNVSSWLLCLTNIRNYCAHYSRLYYNRFGTIPATPKGFPYILSDRVFDYILVLKFLYPDPIAWKNGFLIALQALIDEYNGVIDMPCIGFPVNWEKLLL